MFAPDDRGRMIELALEIFKRVPDRVAGLPAFLMRRGHMAGDMTRKRCAIQYRLTPSLLEGRGRVKRGAYHWEDFAS